MFKLVAVHHSEEVFQKLDRLLNWFLDAFLCFLHRNEW